MASVDLFRGSSLWPARAVGEDLGIGGLYGFQGLRLSEAAVADKEGRLVKGRSDDKEEEKELMMVAPATSGIKGKAEAGCVNTMAVPGDAVEEAPAEGKKMIKLTVDEIKWILDQKPGNIGPPADKETLLKVYPPEMVDRFMEARLLAAEAMAYMEKGFAAFQDRVRKDFAETGSVMVYDVSREDKESEKEYAYMDMFSESDFGNYSDMYGSDDDDLEEEEEEVDLESTSN